MTNEERQKARDWKRAQRERDRLRLVAAAIDHGDDDPSDEGSSQLLPAGVDATRGRGPAVQDLMSEQALWVQKRRLITELELSRRRGELIPLEDARRQSAALARRIRAALERAPSLLPGDLSPENQSACKTAMAASIRQALAVL